MTKYEEFIESKKLVDVPTGIKNIGEVNPMLYDWQADVVRWALGRGRAAMFEECGLGKTPQSLEWARHVVEYTNKPVLVMAPLAVAPQTIREGEKFGIECKKIADQSEIRGVGIYVTNYEKLINGHIDPDVYGGVVIDESSCLKSYRGVTKTMILEGFKNTPFRLACSATPAPNDHIELGNHAEFLGAMTSHEMLATFFINDGGSSGNYRVKKHAEDDFWTWVCNWAVCAGKPSDLGDYSDEGYILPALNMNQHTVSVDHSDSEEGQLFRLTTLNATELYRELRKTCPQRADKAAEIIEASESVEPWLLWCNTNYEADALKSRIPDAVEIRGSDSAGKKEELLQAFTDGEIQTLITKPSIAGWGLNWQHCGNQAFVGLNYSYEQLHQAIRRSWRFGRKDPVNVHLIAAETEGNVLKAVNEKQRLFDEMVTKMVGAMKQQGMGVGHAMKRQDEVYSEKSAEGEGWKLLLGDCCQRIKEIEDNSVDFSVFSPPFSNVYMYSNLLEDMGNSTDDEQYYQHMKFLAKEMYRILRPGRQVAIHCQDLVTYESSHGQAGLRDMPGEILRIYQEAGFTYHSKVTIWKCPVTEMQRTKNHGLLYSALRKDSSRSRQGRADYIIVLRKYVTPETEHLVKPVTHTEESFPLMQWQRWASPVWDDIDQTNVLNVRVARNEKDERHLCPLQLDLIERCIRLWSSEGDTVFSPFAGIGSEGYVALDWKRKFIGIELKPSYFETAVENLTDISTPDDQISMFEVAE